MRDIWFRGKRIDNGEWVYGSYQKLENSDRSGYDHFIAEPFVNEYTYDVIPESIGQYIGLNDHTGKRIFEGDIVDILTENEELGVVEYDDGGFIVSADGFTVDFLNNINGADVKVVGNIHDNIEMIGWWQKE